MLFRLCLVLCLALAIVAQVSRPVADDAQLTKLQQGSSFATKKVVAKGEVTYGQDATRFQHPNKCKHSDLDVRWQAQVGSSIYQTPIVFDLFGDGKKEVIVPTFVRFLEVLQGTNGAEAHSMISTTHRHTADDEVQADHLNKEEQHDKDTSKTSEPQVHAHKHEHELQQWPFSNSQFASHASSVLYDIDKDGQMEIVQVLVTGEVVFFKQSGSVLKPYTIKVLPLPVHKHWHKGLDDSTVDVSVNLSNEQKPSADSSKNTKIDDPDAVEKKTTKKRRQLNSMDDRGKPNPNEKSKTPLAARVQPDKTRKIAMKPTAMGFFSKEARDAFDLVTHVPQSLRPFIDEQTTLNPFHTKSYEPAVQELKKKYPANDFVLVDAHLLSAPVIIDLDNDGHDELILAVSYYFDKELYSRPEVPKPFEDGLDIGQYIAGGIAVYDLETLQPKWNVHLDLTSDKTKLKAYIYSSPTVVDIDGDGSLEVIVGTALGFIYVYDKKGKPKIGFPVQMGQIQGQVVAEDVNGDGDIELCAVDFRSNIACFDYRGKSIWDRQISGFSSQAPAVGDINGDGILELVVGTSTGHIWALRGDNGKSIEHFPIRTNGAIYSPVLITTLNTTTPSQYSFTSYLKYSRVEPTKALTIVVPSFDGYVYLIDGHSGCIDKIDIGEKAYSQVLIDDLTGNDKMDLLITTMNGNVYTFGTSQPYHPLKTSWAQMQSVNGFAYRHNYHGIFVQKSSRTFRDVIGNNFKVHFEIVDKREMPAHIPRKYNVKISIGKQVTLLSKVYTKPGKYIEMLSTPNERMFGTVLVEMMNEHGQVYLDAFSVSFNMGFLSVIKWAIVVPFVLCAAVLLYVDTGKAALPT